MRLEHRVAATDCLLRHARHEKFRVGTSRWAHSHAPLDRPRFLWEPGTAVDIRLPGSLDNIPTRPEVFTAYDTHGTRTAEDAIMFKRGATWRVAIASILPYNIAEDLFPHRFRFQDLPQHYEVELTLEKQSLGREARLALVTEFEAFEGERPLLMLRPAFSIARVHATRALYDPDLPRKNHDALPPGLRALMRFMAADRPGRAVRELLHAHASIYGAALAQEQVPMVYTHRDDHVESKADAIPLAFVNAPYRVAADAVNLVQGFNAFYGQRFSRRTVDAFCACISQEAHAEREVRNNPGRYERRQAHARHDTDREARPRYVGGRRVA